MTEVHALLAYDVTEPTVLVLQLGAARATGRYELTSNGEPVAPQEIQPGALLVEAEPGRLTVRYDATVDPAGGTAARVSAGDRVVALRPSRYCPSDRMGGFATGLVGQHDTARDRVLAICDHVAGHLSYASGSSDATTDAVDTLLSGAGVCRDYAHLVAALCRAVGVPARVASVYAPGLYPMDFHLVAEAVVDSHWYVFDATRLAPRPSLVRIATGRDAADVAFGTVLSGHAEMNSMEIRAVTAGDLPYDDHRDLVPLA
jgi:transglutaminase-like putative cysteine protease